MKIKLLPKFILSLAVLAIVLTVAISLFSYNTSKVYLEGMYADRVTVNSKAIASMLDLEDVRTILAPDGERPEAHARLAVLLNKLKAEGEVTFLSLVVPDEDSVTFYIDAMVPEMGDDPANQLPYGSDIPYVEAASDEADLKNYQIIWEQYQRNLGLDEPVITDNAYGYNYTGVAPVLDESGRAIAEIQYILDMNGVRAFLNSVLIRMLLISFAITIVAMLIYVIFVRKAVTLPIGKLAKFTKEITASDSFADQRSDIRTGDEIESLSDSFNYMLDEIREYMDNLSHVTAEKERIGTELALATRIQADMLPNIFPAFPERDDFDIYASMTPAKEVGGDFYDFFLIDDSHMGLVMADVSGKGVPAALFMMIAKILIQNFAMTGRNPSAVLEKVNEQICKNNREEMFVTVWFGVLDLDTGRLTAANAGHEYPVLKRPNGEFEIIKDKHGFVIGGMDGVRYKEYTLQMDPGSVLFLYTDGVPEATNAENELFGMERAVDALNADTNRSPQELLQGVTAAVNEFVGAAPQFDDLTMLAINYIGKREGPAVLTFDAVIDNIPKLTDFINERLEAMDCPMKAQMQIDVAIDEVFANIANYAYPDGTGSATVEFEERQDPHGITLTFIDSGIPFNPLEMKDPDTTLSAEERSIGGLGIFMVKKSMDDVSYRYEDGHNILTIQKNF